MNAISIIEGAKYGCNPKRLSIGSKYDCNVENRLFLIAMSLKSRSYDFWTNLAKKLWMIASIYDQF